MPIGTFSQKKPKSQPQGSSQITAELDTSDASWLQQQSQCLAMVGLVPPATNTQSSDIPLQSQPPQPFDLDDEMDNVSDINPNEAHLINHFLPFNDTNGEPPEVVNFGDYVKGPTYKSKQIKEAMNWRKVFGPMFLDFMVESKQKTQWGKDNWDEDHNKPCSCGPGKHRVRKLDLVDLTSRKQQAILFCDCLPDQVRLIRMGYIGGSPIHPETAFSIRLLRLHHSLWKYCTVRTQGFSLGFDEFLDPANPLLLVSGTSEPQRWRRPFSLAVDAYRKMLQNEEELTMRALSLTTMERLAMNCPRCFGPLQANPDSDEPDYIVCVDGNFQHRRHKAASREHEEIGVSMPSLFVDPQKVEEWEPRRNKHDAKTDDRCSAQHTAAADQQGGLTWKAADETGLIGMACRHDHVLSFVNVVQSGERQYYVLSMIDKLLQEIAEPGSRRKRLGVLYDIGCTLEKSIIKNKIFQVQCQERGLKFGTSAFHSYVHEWACQLHYNPRMNKGWGRSDGEGLERIWSFLSPLVSPLQYSTKQHWADALHLKATHRNAVTRANAVRASWIKVKEYERLLDNAKTTLDKLGTEKSIYTRDYFAAQWERQKTCQLEAISSLNFKKLEEKLAELLEQEEKLNEAHAELKRLQRKQRRHRTEADVVDITTLPGSIVAMETAAQKAREELGDPEFQQIRENTTLKGRALIRVRLAKMKLYEAKVGIVEAQKQWDQCGLGTSVQQSFKAMMTKKQLTFRRKWTTYNTQAMKYNDIRPFSNLPCPTLEEAKALPFEDPFWNVGALSHPEEMWANDPGTKDGIQAYLLHRSCMEEL
ncbi:hypothetical protein DFH28DRAFT_1128352 [Melampsora americana]|nr:hypothetical protein DFH28DRAFT_1128352 [Melampsora americana]